MRGLDRLARELHQIDGAGYGAYKRVSGAWGDERCRLYLDRVQGDPFAAPSRVRLEIPADVHGLPALLWSGRARRVAFCDFVARAFARAAAGMRSSARGGSGGSGRVSVDAGGAELLARSACHVDDDGGLSLRFRVGLPARGRRVMGRAAAELLTRAVPDAAAALHHGRLDVEEAERWALLAEDHEHLQGVLAERGLVAFVRDGSVLPRASGVSARPLAGAVPFTSPESLRVTLQTLHHGEVTGMGVPPGVTLITGGGFHGKTTLLSAIQAGIDPHIPGDGREWVVTVADAIKVRSEDGRAVTGVDLSPFIQDLPRSGDGSRRSTRRFTTADASGSTSLAAAIVESIELGATTLLIDEDTSATNLLIRDARMQALVQRETITPLIDRVRELHREHGVSTVLVVGGCGDYLDVADTVLLLEDYRPQEVGARALQIAREHPTGRTPSQSEREPFAVRPRTPTAKGFDARTRSRGGRPGREKIRARGLREISFGDEIVDLGALEQLVDESQARAIGVLLRQIGRRADGRTSLATLAAEVLESARRTGLYRVDNENPLPDLAMVRVQDLGAAVNRLRSLEIPGEA